MGRTRRKPLRATGDGVADRKGERRISSPETTEARPRCPAPSLDCLWTRVVGESKLKAK